MNKLSNFSILETYETLHQLAEPSWKEERTSAYLVERLRQAGLQVKTFPHHFGIIAEIPGLTNEVVALRADLDALVQEVDGNVKAHHSCGHDAHSTMVLHAALSIAKRKMVPYRTLRFIFQPAEEVGAGALQMVEDGALNNVVYLFGIHVRPAFEVPFGKASAIIKHGSAGTIKGQIKGRQAHAARPQDGINVIESAALIVQQLKEMILSITETYSIKMTQLQVYNEATNIIPETATFTLDVRAQTNELMEALKKQTASIINHVMQQCGSSIEYEMTEYVPAAIPNAQAMAIAKQAISDVLGSQYALDSTTSQGGEDFHFYTLKQPTIKATMIGLGCDLKPGLHHPNMHFNVDALEYGTEILIKTMLLASNMEE
ncbi:MAG: amidohydrolase [Bacillaceae bacterium]